MTDGDGCWTLLLLIACLIGGILLGIGWGIAMQQRDGIALGTVTATAGVMTVAGEGTLVAGPDGPVLVVAERQGAVVSTSYLLDWVRVERAVSR